MNGNTTSTSSPARPEPSSVSEAALLVCAVIYVVLAVLVLLGNGLVIVSFCWRVHLRSHTNFFIVSLSVADAFVGMISVPWWVHLMFAEHDGASWFRFVHNIWLIFDILGGVCSILHLVALSWDRLWAIVWPLNHRTFSSTRYLLLLSLIWLTSVTVAALSIPGMQYAPMEYNVSVIGACFFLPLAVICVTQAVIMHSIRRRTRYPNRRFGLRRNVRVAKTIVIMIGLFCIGWLPFFSLSLASFVNPTIGKNVPFWALHAVKFLQYSNSAVNPVLYAHKFPHFRKAYARMLCSCCGFSFAGPVVPLQGTGSYSITLTTTSSMCGSRAAQTGPDKVEYKKQRPPYQSSQTSAARSATPTDSFLLPSSFAAKAAAAGTTGERAKHGTPVIPRSRVLLKPATTPFPKVLSMNISEANAGSSEKQLGPLTTVSSAERIATCAELREEVTDNGTDINIDCDTGVFHKSSGLRNSRFVEDLTAVEESKAITFAPHTTQRNSALRGGFTRRSLDLCDDPAYESCSGICRSKSSDCSEDHENWEQRQELKPKLTNTELNFVKNAISVRDVEIWV